MINVRRLGTTCATGDLNYTPFGSQTTPQSTTGKGVSKAFREFFIKRVGITCTPTRPKKPQSQTRGMDVCGAYRHNVEYKPSQEGHGGDPGNVPGDEIEGVSRRGAEVRGEDRSLQRCRQGQSRREERLWVVGFVGIGIGIGIGTTEVRGRGSCERGFRGVGLPKTERRPIPAWPSDNPQQGTKEKARVYTPARMRSC